jgi:hypothetical protein
MKLTMENATYKLMHEILNALNNKLILGGIFCDLEKAFGCVNHASWLSKLETCGITGKDKELLSYILKDSIKEFLINTKTHHFWHPL